MVFFRVLGAQSRSPRVRAHNTAPTPRSRRPRSKTPCKCLPSVFHLTSPVLCDLLPAACPKTKIPSFFKMRGTKEGNSVPQLERHIMQESGARSTEDSGARKTEDFFDASSWSESGIYLHEQGEAFGRHGAALVGWGSDSNSRDYWLLLNSFGMQWQQGGYFKVLRGDTDLEMLHYGAWGADFQLSAAERKRFPAIFAVEVSFSPVPERHGLASEPLTELEHVWLRVAFATDEPATSLIRVSGLATGLTAEVAEAGRRSGADVAAGHVAVRSSNVGVTCQA
eukprot:g21259.t1